MYIPNRLALVLVESAATYLRHEALATAAAPIHQVFTLASLRRRLTSVDELLRANSSNFSLPTGMTEERKYDKIH